MQVLLLVAILTGLAQASHQPVRCVWGDFSPWSECDGCTNNQTRWRQVLTFPQFGGSECRGSGFETRSCTSSRGCPLETGCQDQFRCASGRCVPQELTCNSDEDCEGDNLDERNCEQIKPSCDVDQPPPQVELTGLGYDVVKGAFRGNVLSPKSFGGTCRKVFNGDNRRFYRLPQSTIKYTFQVTAKSDFTSEIYRSSWDYYTSNTQVRHGKSRGIFRRRRYHSTTHSSSTASTYKGEQYLWVHSEVAVAQFLTGPVDALSVSTPLWTALSHLPSTYDYSAYRALIEAFGTHYVHSGSLGGRYSLTYILDTANMEQEGLTEEIGEYCSSTSVNLLFVSYKDSACDSHQNSIRRVLKTASGAGRAVVASVGGSASALAALSLIDVNNPRANSEVYRRWAASVRQLPVIINQKLRPLHELVKDGPCAATKRQYLKRAAQRYLAESDPCHCRPCANNGRTAVIHRRCVCLCHPNTAGVACELGRLLHPDNQGGTHGGWGCWTEWSPCGVGRRSRRRRCDNPTPRGGGRGCEGQTSESEGCGEGERQHLRALEPHCFQTDVGQGRTCSPPPAPPHSFVQDLASAYAVGSSAVYRCDPGFFAVSGEPVVRCGQDLRWSPTDLRCDRTACVLPDVQPGVRASPTRDSYRIGDKVSFSCPEGHVLEGPSQAMCDSNLRWTEDTAAITCRTPPTVTSKHQGPQCPPWQTLRNAQCVCKLPYQCRPSLVVCAVSGPGGRPVWLTVCKLKVLLCLGRGFTLTPDSACHSLTPPATPTCANCPPGLVCDAVAGGCVCEEPGECGAGADGGMPICVRYGDGDGDGDGEPLTMSECRAGALRCRGEDVRVVTAGPCLELSPQPPRLTNPTPTGTAQ